MGYGIQCGQRAGIRNLLLRRMATLETANSSTKNDSATGFEGIGVSDTDTLSFSLDMPPNDPVVVASHILFGHPDLVNRPGQPGRLDNFGEVLILQR